MFINVFTWSDLLLIDWKQLVIFSSLEIAIPNSDEDFIIGKNKHKGKKHIDDIDELDLNELDNDNKILLPKLHLCDYVLNNICCKKCITSKKQMLITECNYILSKYFSVEKIILNQLIFENLLSDYNWNELSLEEFENNQNISRLKKYI